MVVADLELEPGLQQGGQLVQLAGTLCQQGLFGSLEPIPQVFSFRLLHDQMAVNFDRLLPVPLPGVHPGHGEREFVAINGHCLTSCQGIAPSGLSAITASGFNDHLLASDHAEFAPGNLLDVVRIVF